MRVLVAGGAGALGRPVVAALRRAGHEVTAPSRAPTRGELHCDFTQTTQVQELVDALRPDVLIDLITDLGEDFRTVTLGLAYHRNHVTRRSITSNLRQAAEAAGTPRLLSQTVCFTGESGSGPASEERPLLSRPPRPWQTLLRTQRVVESTVPAGRGPHGVVLRLGFLWGPGTWWSSDGSYTRAVRRQHFPLIGTGQGQWAWWHVEDAATAFVRALTHGSGPINIADGQALSLGHWLPRLASAAGAAPPHRLPAAVARAVGAGVAAYTSEHLPAPSVAKASEVLSWKPARAWSAAGVLSA